MDWMCMQVRAMCRSCFPTEITAVKMQTLQTKTGLQLKDSESYEFRTKWADV